MSYGDVEDQWSPHHSPHAVQQGKEDELDYSEEYKEMGRSGKFYDKINESFTRGSIKDFFRKYSY